MHSLNCPERVNTICCSLLTSLKGYLQILHGPSVIPSHLYWLFFFLLPLLSSLNRSQLSSLPQHSKLVCFLTYCILPTHAAFLLHFLAPEPIPPLQSWQTSQAYKLVASGTPRMQQWPNPDCELPATPLWCGGRGHMALWIVEQSGQLHLLDISRVTYGFTLHLTKNLGIHKRIHIHGNVFSGLFVW